MKGFVYIMTNKNNSVLYTGVTSDLKERVIQHKTKKYLDSFSSRYNICKLIYYESFETIGEAIKREKKIKSGFRNKKIEIINGMNPEWEDLSLILGVKDCRTLFRRARNDVTSKVNSGWELNRNL